MSEVLQAFTHGAGDMPTRGFPPPLASAGRRPAVPPVTFVARSLSWMSRGACQQADPGLFFPVAVAGPAKRQAEAAKAVCGPCDVRASCLSYALEAMPEGVWGGTTTEERRAARKRPVRRRASAQSPDPASAAMTGENATRAGHDAQQQAPRGRTA